jgi:hypothetical protein
MSLRAIETFGREARQSRRGVFSSVKLERGYCLPAVALSPALSSTLITTLPGA